jgi:hypothetical protein
MKLRRHILTLAVLVAATPAAAQGLQGFEPAPSQGFGPAPGQLGGFTSPPGPGGGFSPPPGQGFNSATAAPQAEQGEPPCFKEFSALRAETEKRGKAIQAAGKRKAPPQEACKLFNSLLSAETKFINFIDKNQKWCGIPPQVPKQIKEGHAKIQQIRDRLCQLAAAGPAHRAGPSLSDALGTTRLPDSSNIKTGKGGGTFDTLTGSPLAK